jgi:hypothetical protein
MITQRGVSMFSLTDREYGRWLELEAAEQRLPAEEAELQGYLEAIIAAEERVRQWVVDSLRPQPDAPEGRGADRADIYRAVARRLPAAWGLRMVARVHGECRHRDDVYAGKMLIIDEALLALCSSDQVEAVPGPLGYTTFRLSPNHETALQRGEPERGRTGLSGARRRKETAQVKRATRHQSSAAKARADLGSFLASLGVFVGFDQ